MAILRAFTRLADRFDQPARPAPPTVPRFTDSYRNWPRFRKDIEAYLGDFYARADERVRVLFLKEKCFSTAALAKIVHLETVDEILAVLGECYVRPDRYVDEVLGPVRKMRSLDEYDAIGLESFYATVLATCAEAQELGQYESLANPVVSGVMIDKLPLGELRDYDSYRMEGQVRRFLSELRGFEEFVKGRLPGVQRLADRQTLGVLLKKKKAMQKKGVRGQRKMQTGRLIMTGTVREGKKCTGWSVGL